MKKRAEGALKRNRNPDSPRIQEAIKLDDAECLKTCMREKAHLGSRVRDREELLKKQESCGKSCQMLEVKLVSTSLKASDPEQIKNVLLANPEFRKAADAADLQVRAKVFPGSGAKPSALH